MSTGRRLLEFINKCYKNQTNFSRETNISKGSISRYVLGNALPDTKKLDTMHKYGLSLDWFISGTGLMYANNEIGKMFKKKFLEKVNCTDDSFTARIKDWINKYYHTIEILAICTESDINELEKMFEEKKFTTPEMMDILEFAGMNNNWIFGEEEIPFNDSLAGLYFKRQYNYSTESIEKLAREKKYTFDDLMKTIDLMTKVQTFNKNGN